MANATNEIDIDKPADEVWGVVRDFGGLAGWMPGIESCRVEGNQRVLIANGMELVETLHRSDDAARTVVYGLVKSPMPVEHHEATIAVTPTGDASSRVTWSVEIKPDAMIDNMSNVYAGALKALKSTLEG